jgi:hypothetical protein
VSSGLFLAGLSGSSVSGWAAFRLSLLADQFLTGSTVGYFPVYQKG